MREGEEEEARMMRPLNLDWFDVIYAGCDQLYDKSSAMQKL